MPRHKGVFGVEWDRCDRCGFLHPINMLTIQQGRKLCSDHGCLDDLSPYYRQKVIADSLANSQEGKSDKPEVLKGPGELTF
jgi:hypothetical protein